MAIKISGSTIIDNGRNIVDANDISISGNLIVGIDSFPLVGILTAGSNATLDDYFGSSLATNIDETIKADLEAQADAKFQEAQQALFAL